MPGPVPLRTIVDDNRTLLVRRRGPTLELVLGNVVLLSSAALETEASFGRLAVQAPMLPSGVKRILIGGLGFAATVRGVQEVTTRKTEIVVVEKLQAVIDLARAEAAPLVANALDDPRVDVRHADVVDAIGE